MQNELDPSKDPRLIAMKNLKEQKDVVVFHDVSVQQILDHKAGGQVASVATVSPNDTVYSAIKKMNSVRVGALVVTDDQGKPVGMISERDYLNKVILRGFSSKEITVKGMLEHLAAPLRQSPLSPPLTLPAPSHLFPFSFPHSSFFFVHSIFSYRYYDKRHCDCYLRSHCWRLYGDDDPRKI